jgi:hypothetical protein
MGWLKRLFRGDDAHERNASIPFSPSRAVNPASVGMGSNLESALLAQCWEQMKVIYGLTGAFDESDSVKAGLVRDLVDQIDYYPHTITRYEYHDSLEKKSGQKPPFKSTEELCYDLRKKAEMIVFWICNPSFGFVYGFENYTPGDQLHIAILDSESDTIGGGMHQHRTLGPDLSVREAISPRPFDIVGVFSNSSDENIESLKKNLASKDTYIRRVSAWGLGFMRDRAKVVRVAGSDLKRLAADTDADTREYASRLR